jgi:hypothetical protein
VLVVADERDLAVERERLRALVTRFAAAGPDGCPAQPHAFLGRLTPEEWGVLRTSIPTITRGGSRPEWGCLPRAPRTAGACALGQGKKRLTGPGRVPKARERISAGPVMRA